MGCWEFLEGLMVRMGWKMKIFISSYLIADGAASREIRPGTVKGVKFVSKLTGTLERKIYQHKNIISSGSICCFPILSLTRSNSDGSVMSLCVDIQFVSSFVFSHVKARMHLSCLSGNVF